MRPHCADPCYSTAVAPWPRHLRTAVQAKKPIGCEAMTTDSNHLRLKACKYYAWLYIEIAKRRLRRNLIAAFSAYLFLFNLHGSVTGHIRSRTTICTQGTGLANEELMTVGGKINEISPDGRFGVTLDNEHRIIAYTAGKLRRHRIRSVVGDHVHMEMKPYDLTKGRIIYRGQTLGQGPAGVRRRVIRR